MQKRRYEQACDFLKEKGLRYSRQRMVVISEIIFGELKEEHFRIGDLLVLIQNNHETINISNASLINILRGFCDSGHLREVYAGKLYYDTIMTPHAHFYDKENGVLFNIDKSINFTCLMNSLDVPDNYQIDNLNLIVELNQS